MPFLDLQEHLAEAFGSHVLDDFRGFSVKRVESASEVRERMQAWEAANPERAKACKREQERKRRASGAKRLPEPPGVSTERSRRFRERNPSYYRERRKKRPEDPAKTRVRYLRRKERLARKDNDKA